MAMPTHPIPLRQNNLTVRYIYNQKVASSVDKATFCIEKAYLSVDGCYYSKEKP